MLLGFVLLTVVGLVTVVPSLRDWLQQRGVRRGAARVEGRVVDIDVHDFYSLRGTRPIARYHLADHDYEAPVGNFLGRLPLDSSIELLVNPSTPFVAVAARGHSTTATLLVRSAITAVGAVGLAYLLAVR